MVLSNFVIYLIFMDQKINRPNYNLVKRSVFFLNFYRGRYLYPDCGKDFFWASGHMIGLLKQVQELHQNYQFDTVTFQKYYNMCYYLSCIQRYGSLNPHNPIQFRTSTQSFLHLINPFLMPANALLCYFTSN